ncbi:MAG: hypothetical protein WDO68_10760 [Gammaproteobacteria bacterium]
MKSSFLSAAVWLCAFVVLAGGLQAAVAADVTLSGGPWLRNVSRVDLDHGAGSDFRSPLDVDVLIATLSVSNTLGSNWSLRIACETNEAGWPPGLTIAVRRSGGWDESGLSDGTSYRALTPDLQTLFSGAGDYSTIQILMRVDGLSARMSPGSYELSIRYVIETGGP